MSAQPAPGILAMGVAVPRLRVAASEYAAAWGHFSGRDIEEKTVPSFDEDAITLAVEAARRALAASGVDPASLSLVAFATGGPDAGAAVVAEALGAPHARLLDVTGRPTAGLAALSTAFDAVSGGARHVLVVASDVPRGAPSDGAEHAQGSGAAAFLLGPGGAVTRFGAASATRDHPGERFLDGQGFLRSPEVPYDSDALVAEAVASLPPEALQPDFVARSPGDLVIPGPDGKPLEAARALPDLRKRMGEAGAAHALLALAQALDGGVPGTEGVVAAAGASAAEVLRLAVLRKPHGSGDVARALQGNAPKRVTLLRAMQERGIFAGATGIPEEPMGAYVSLPAFAETVPARYRLEAQRCVSCGALQYPPRAACAECAGQETAPETLSGQGTVYSFTVIGRGGAPSEFALQQALTGEYAVAVVELAEGPRIAVQLTDVDVASLRIGMPVEGVLRRLYRQQGITRYGLKFRPR